jgi:hypothetical protein
MLFSAANARVGMETDHIKIPDNYVKWFRKRFQKKNHMKEVK